MKRNITQMKAKIERDGASSDFTILECRLQILESYFKQISHIQSQIEKLDETDAARSDVEELFISAKAPLALPVIEPFPVIESNYQKAFDHLVKRYDNKTLIFIDNIKSLFSLAAITKPNAVALRSILDSVSALQLVAH
ncbi:hypothetical protein EVAR_101378_1 [Eumeta japonica]|uniref:Uncharacterized protein n=1 Tax=Eumeta variegata TaxID=151549 RepID=A0A4C1SI23_EUMVA|nr:hypothetical protein EVAR_101378_1 [Eumeta japonica]